MSNTKEVCFETPEAVLFLDVPLATNRLTPSRLARVMELTMKELEARKSKVAQLFEIRGEVWTVEEILAREG